MSETNPVVDGQVPGNTTPQQADPAKPTGQVPDGNQNSQPQPAPQNANPQQTYSQEYVADLRKEAATYRTKANDAQKQLEAALGELNTIKAEQKATQVKAAFAEAANEAGALYPDPIFALVSERIKVDDATGLPEPENLKTVLAEVQKSYPGLFKQPARTPTGKDIGAGAKGDAPAGDFNTWVRQNL